MDIMIVVVLIGVGIVIGMYVSSQVESHIENRTQNGNLLENLRKLDRQDIMDKPMSQTREALLARHKTKLSSEFKDIPEEIKVEEDRLMIEREAKFKKRLR
jgi:type III secretory pathway component EscR|tara:strand:- start:3460 stop:3762 length:303 start_codon:yes stop_codon:yes gene_type:complete